MTSSIPLPPPGSFPDASQHVHERLREISELVPLRQTPHDFFQVWLEKVVDALAAVGGAVWAADPALEPLAEYRSGCEDAWFDRVDGRSGRHAAMIQRSLTRGEPRIIPPDSAVASDPEAGNPSDYLLIHCPIFRNGQAFALVEIVQRAATSLAAQDGYLRFLTVAAESAEAFLQRHAATGIEVGISEHQSTAPAQQPMQQAVTQVLPGAEFLYQLHESLDLEATAYAIVNDGRLQLGCDRVTLLAVRGVHCRVLAISGVEQPDRANMVRVAEQLASAAARVNEAIWYDEAQADRSPQIAEPLEEFLEETTARVVGVVPLCVRHDRILPPPMGVMIVECFLRQDASRLQQQSAAIETQCAIALRNALRFDRVAWLRILAPLGQRDVNALPGRRRRWLIFGGLALLLASVLTFVETDLTVPARGELQPRERRDVFAPSDGIVEQVLVAHEARVQQGQPLVVLRDSALELEFRRVTGAIETARKRLNAVQTLRLDQRDPARGDPVDRQGRFSGEEEEIKEELRSLQEQLAVLQRRQDELTLRSPLDGQVLTWNVSDALDTRPVRRGQVLLTVARLDGPWELQLEIPEDRAGHVLAARRDRPSQLDVTFILSNHPEATFSEKLDDIALVTEVNETEGPYLPATVVLPAERVPRSRPGTTVSARIVCGRRALGYVWLHDVYEALVARLWY